ncbi:creatinine amidohydrolase [Seinonella peptonophila]|uniref:Creatinine amidohydrolase n=1 Tax=Seinonella peptonophila TaxID=112248 RepID=A0A1M4SXA7_9BACL|nr:creatininase family protein [Seinonella peptonophila]SHE36798.1 creatinine amidohydrolase [Seinonella peptonophila]
MQFDKQNSYEISDLIHSSKTAILPVGAVEAHGPHLPLGTDNLLAERLSNLLAKRVNGLVLPTLPYGQVWSLRDFPGSLTLSNQTLTQMIVEIGESLFQQGIRLFVIVNGHYGNAVALKEAARVLYDSFQKNRVMCMFYPGTKKIIEEVRESPSVHDSYFHACELETSYMLYLANEYVDMSRAIQDIPEIPAETDISPTPWSQFTKSAVLGDATKATYDKGEKIILAALDEMERMILKAKDDLGC